MVNFFRYFPEERHTQRLLTDITRRIQFREDIATDPYVFLPYTVKEDYKPEDVSFYYYGDVSYTWAVYFSNDIIDPSYDWPLNNKDFDAYIIDNYASNANTTGQAVLEWAQNTQIDDNILYYNLTDGNEEFRISAESFDLASSLDPDFIGGDWTAIRVYDYEFQRNENKREILLISDEYIDQISREVQRIFND